jgi:transcriptional regulator with XRE-family HTH domain
MRSAREERRLTQRRLGELAGISSETVRAYERGARFPRRKQLLSILDALNVDSAKRKAILEGAGFAAQAVC